MQRIAGHGNASRLSVLNTVFQPARGEQLFVLIDHIKRQRLAVEIIGVAILDLAHFKRGGEIQRLAGLIGQAIGGGQRLAARKVPVVIAWTFVANLGRSAPCRPTNPHWLS